MTPQIITVIPFTSPSSSKNLEDATDSQWRYHYQGVVGYLGVRIGAAKDHYYLQYEFRPWKMDVG